MTALSILALGFLVYAVTIRYTFPAIIGEGVARVVLGAEVSHERGVAELQTVAIQTLSLMIGSADYCAALMWAALTYTT